MCDILIPSCISCLLPQALGKTFARACNLGAKKAKAKWLLFLSSQVALEDMWLSELLDPISSYSTSTSQAGNFVPQKHFLVDPLELNWLMHFLIAHRNK